MASSRNLHRDARRHHRKTASDERDGCGRHRVCARHTNAHHRRGAQRLQQRHTLAGRLCVLLRSGFVKTGLGTRIAYMLISKFGRSTLGLGYSLVATDLVLAPAMPSNTARAAGVVFPIVQAISRKAIESDPVKGRKTSAFLVLAAYEGTVITSGMFVTSMVANPLIVQLAAAQKFFITWSGWSVAALVPAIVSLVIVPFIVYKMCPPGAIKTPEAPAMAKEALSQLGPMKRSEK